MHFREPIYQAFFCAFFLGSKGSETPVAWVFRPILLSFPENLLEFSIFFVENRWVFIKSPSVFDKFRAKIEVLHQNGVYFAWKLYFWAAFKQNGKFFLSFLHLITMSFEKNDLKTSGSLSFGAENTLSFFKAWVFFTLSFSKTQKSLH